MSVAESALLDYNRAMLVISVLVERLGGEVTVSKADIEKILDAALIEHWTDGDTLSLVLDFNFEFDDEPGVQ